MAPFLDLDVRPFSVLNSVEVFQSRGVESHKIESRSNGLLFPPLCQLSDLCNLKQSPDRRFTESTCFKGMNAVYIDKYLERRLGWRTMRRQGWVFACLP